MEKSNHFLLFNILLEPSLIFDNLATGKDYLVKQRLRTQAVKQVEHYKKIQQRFIQMRKSSTGPLRIISSSYKYKCPFPIWIKF